MAVLVVFANHLFGKPVGGFTGVDVFFVISGFLITGLLEREYNRTRRISIKGFYIRRARRILPGAVLVLVTSGLCAHFMFYAARTHQTITDILWAGGFLANVHFAATGTDYFHANRPPSPVQHFWSLSVEEQFYLVWPLLLFALSFLAVKLARRFAHQLLSLVVGVVLIALFALGIRQTRQDSATAYFATTARAWELGIGALLAIVLARRDVISKAVRYPCFIAGLALIAYSAVHVTESGRFPAPGALYAVLGAGLVIVGGTGPALGPVMWPLTNSASRYVGRVSYSLYLWHWPVIVFLPVLMPVHDAYFNVTAVCTAAAITAISFHFVEDPLRRMDYRAASRQLRRALRGRAHLWRNLHNSTEYRRNGVILLASTSVFALGLVAVALQPPPRLPAFALPLVETNTASTTAATEPPGVINPPASITRQVTEALGADSFPTLRPSVSEVGDAHGPEWKICGNVSAATLSRCTFPAQGPAPAKKLVLLGDSFGIAWAPTMRAAQAQGYTVYEMTHSQCPAIDESFTELVGNSRAFTAACNAARNWYVSEIAKLKPDIVVIGNYDAMLNNLVGHPKGQAAVQEWAAGARKIIARVKAAGARRIVWMASPPLSGDLTRCDQSSSATPAQCVRKIGGTWSEVTDAERTVAQQTHITMLDTRLFFCAANGYCPAFVGHTPTHVDGDHITGVYAKAIGPYVIPYVLGTKKTAA